MEVTPSEKEVPLTVNVNSICRSLEDIINNLRKLTFIVFFLSLVGKWFYSWPCNQNILCSIPGGNTLVCFKWQNPSLAHRVHSIKCNSKLSSFHFAHISSGRTPIMTIIEVPSHCSLKEDWFSCSRKVLRSKLEVTHLERNIIYFNSVPILEYQDCTVN